MATRDAFEAAYAQLNTAQRKAVDTIEGPVMVIAGPGTGKTQILTLRIANIMRQSDVPADAILALTFTNAAAANMRKRLVSIVGAEGYRVSIFTFHSFANHLIEQYPERFGAIPGFTNISEVEQLDVLRSLLDQGSYERIKPLGDPYRRVRDLIQAITHLKKEGIDPASFSAWVEQEITELEARPDLVHEKGAHAGKIKVVHQRSLQSLEANREVAELYRRYQDELVRRKRYDFDDALLTLISALEKSEDFLRELQEEYQYFLVDEHQDTNGAQNRILELLVTWFETPNLFVVGDEKQAIFRFQGASLANFLYFKERFHDVVQITLSENYRSHQGILDASHELIRHAREGIPAPLVARTGTVAPIDVYRFHADDEELLFLAETVRTKINEGVAAHELCILYRNNRDVEPIRDYFERLGIPFVVESGHGVLDDPDIRKLNTLLAALRDLDDDDAVARSLFIGFLGIPVPDAYTLLREARTKDLRLYQVLAKSAELDLIDRSSSIRLYRDLSAWKAAAENEPFLQFFERVVNESGLLTHIQRSVFHVEKFDKVVRLFDELKAHVLRQPYFALADYLSFLTILKEHNLTLDAKPRRVPNAVRLMTAHKAKGLEFDEVFIVNAYDGHWGGKRARSGFRLPYANADQKIEQDDTEDERRLFYVALTRARKHVHISLAVMAPDGKERVPTQFIAEIAPELMRERTAEDVGVAGKRPPLFVPKQTIAGSAKYAAFVQAAFAERGLSATALNSYLACPWKWFYEHFFHTQFVKGVHQKRGTAVHGALQDYFNARNHDSHAPKELLLARFSERLLAEDLESQAFERVLRDTGVSLSGWFDLYQSQWPLRSVNEFRVKGVVLEDVLLTGTIDKLECLDDRCSAVNVVDYKTGKPKSRNEIEGLTKAKGAGDYKRQLVFYKLLLDTYEGGKYHMEEATLDFVEPNESGAYKKESFMITEPMVEELRATILKVASEIRGLTFWDERCDEVQCEACALRDLMDHE